MKKEVNKKATVWARVLRICLLALVAAIIGLNVYMLNASRLAGDVLPMPFGVGMTVVLSGSMEPELSVGDLLIVIPSDEYKVDDVVVFQDGRTGVVHRIIEIEGEDVITRGDANNTEDAPIKYSQIKGRVVFAIPAIGYLVNIIKTPFGTVALLIIAILLMEGSFDREKKADKDALDHIRNEIEKLKMSNRIRPSKKGRVIM